MTYFSIHAIQVVLVFYLSEVRIVEPKVLCEVLLKIDQSTLMTSSFQPCQNTLSHILRPLGQIVEPELLYKLLVCHNLTPLTFGLCINCSIDAYFLQVNLT